MTLQAEEENFMWTENATNICYSVADSNGVAEMEFCGRKDRCSSLGMVLPLFMEMTWTWQLRAALYLIALLYRLVLFYIGLDLNPIEFVFYPAFSEFPSYLICLWEPWRRSLPVQRKLLWPALERRLPRLLRFPSGMEPWQTSP